MACLALIRNALYEGNERVKNVIKNSVHNKAETFDKIIILMLNICESNIQNEEVSEVIIYILFLNKFFSN